LPAAERLATLHLLPASTVMGKRNDLSKKAPLCFGIHSVDVTGVVPLLYGSHEFVNSLFDLFADIEKARSFFVS